MSKFQSRNKVDLMIEIWEFLDCDSVGRSEILAIADGVRERFGQAAVDSPMATARLLADEGAILRHSEIMSLHLEQPHDAIHDAAFRNVIDIKSLESAFATVRRLENLRRKFIADGDQAGLRKLRVHCQNARDLALRKSTDADHGQTRLMFKEIAEWFTIWMQTAETFEAWIDLRLGSPEFKNTFPEFAAN